MSEYATSHATERAAQRYGVIATREDWRQAVLNIIGAAAGERPAKAMLLSREAGAERWGITIGGRAMVAIYDPDRAWIVTVIPWGRNLAERKAHQKRPTFGHDRRNRSERYGERHHEDG